MANEWFAAFLGFISPPLAFIYISKFRFAILYFIFTVISGASVFYIDSEIVVSVLSIVLSIVAIVHAFILAKTVEFGELRKWYNYWWGSLSIPLTIFVVSILFRSFILEPFSIPSASMSPSIEVGDHILVKKWGYGNYGVYGTTLINTNVERRAKLRRGDIAVLVPPNNPNPIVARVIGLPNDVVEFRSKRLIINGELVITEEVENGIFNEYFDGAISSVKYEGSYGKFNKGKWSIPHDQYFVMGDNRNNSADSRVWGTVPVENVVGRYLVKW